MVDELDQYTDEGLIDEIEARGMAVLDDCNGHIFKAAIWALARGEYAEGLLLLERSTGELDGLLTPIVKLLNAASNISDAAEGVRHRAASTAAPGREMIPALDQTTN